MKMKNIFYASCILCLGLCSIYLLQIISNKYINYKYETTQKIILVQSDLFSNVEYVDLEYLISDEKISTLFNNGDKFDTSFKIALFYSDLSIIILKRSRNEKPLRKYVSELMMKSIGKWDDLVAKDHSMLFFKNYYLKIYSETAKTITN